MYMCSSSWLREGCHSTLYSEIKNFTATFLSAIGMPSQPFLISLVMAMRQSALEMGVSHASAEVTWGKCDGYAICLRSRVAYTWIHTNTYMYTQILRPMHIHSIVHVYNIHIYIHMSMYIACVSTYMYT